MTSFLPLRHVKNSGKNYPKGDITQELIKQQHDTSDQKRSLSLLLNRKSIGSGPNQQRWRMEHG